MFTPGGTASKSSKDKEPSDTSAASRTYIADVNRTFSTFLKALNKVTTNLYLSPAIASGGSNILAAVEP